jgi:hypothetical protein
MGTARRGRLEIVEGGNVYGKVFASMYEGSLRGELEAQTVLVYMVVNCDAKGVIDKHPMVIGDANRADSRSGGCGNQAARGVG